MGDAPPALDDERSRVVDDGWRVRRTDYDVLLSSDVADVVREEGIIVTDYRIVQRAWSAVRHGHSGAPIGAQETEQ